MQFSLPTNLQEEVKLYDPLVQRQAKAMAQMDAAKRRVTTSPCGKPNNLFPSHIMKDSAWKDIVKHINEADAESRFYSAHYLNARDGMTVKAVVYYYKQLWVAVWRPEKPTDDYIYGITFAFRDTKAGRKQCNAKFFSHPTILSHYMHDPYDHSFGQRTQVGRCQWFQKTTIITLDTIKQGWTNEYWRRATETHPIHSWGKTWRINQALNQFSEHLLKGVPTFRNGMQSNPWARLLPEKCSLESVLDQYATRPTWVPSGKHYVHDLETHLSYLQSFYRRGTHMKEVLESKWFRRMLQAAMDDVKARHEELSQEDDYDLIQVAIPYARLSYYLKTVASIRAIWTDCNLDLLHSRADLLTTLDISGYHSDTGYQWLRDNLPVTSFLNMMEVSTDKWKEELKKGRYNHVDDRTAMSHYHPMEWRDAYTMLTQCLASNHTEGLKPRRWRTQEFHDHLMAETWKLQHPKVGLPQKLFPEPIKTNGYTFFQPIDTHQLSQWGRVVRNCVGSHGYADGVKKMKHLIVLCMIDNQPRYTIQLTVSNGTMSIDQIVDLSNKRLDDQQRTAIEENFTTALQLREDQLK